MSRGKTLNEVEAKNSQSRTAVNANARPGDPIQKLTTGIPDGQTGSWEDLGGPTPENYKSDDDSAKLVTPGKTLAQVSDVVNRGAKAADPLKGLQAPEDDEEEAPEDEKEEAPKNDEEEDENDKSKKSKKSKKSNEPEEELDEETDEDEEEEEEFDIEDDVNALLSGEELSEEFQEKARTIFEAALRSKVSDIREALEVQYEEALLEEVQTIKEELEDRVDSYLEYVAEEWIQENALVVERGLKEELTESFLSGMKELFEEHYVQLPEEKYDVLENMVEKLDDMETKLNEQIDRNIQLNKRLSESVADRIFGVVADGLAITQKEKLASLAESVEFEGEREYRDKLVTLKESYFPSQLRNQKSQPETLSEGFDIAPVSYSGSMESYLKAASLLSNK